MPRLGRKVNREKMRLINGGFCGGSLEVTVKFLNFYFERFLCDKKMFFSFEKLGKKLTTKKIHKIQFLIFHVTYHSYKPT